MRYFVQFYWTEYGYGGESWIAPQDEPVGPFNSLLEAWIAASNDRNERPYVINKVEE